MNRPFAYPGQNRPHSEIMLPDDRGEEYFTMNGQVCGIKRIGNLIEFRLDTAGSAVQQIWIETDETFTVEQDRIDSLSEALERAHRELTAY